MICLLAALTLWSGAAYAVSTLTPPVPPKEDIGPSFSESVADRYTLPISDIFKVRFSHYAEQAPLVEVLETFARTQGLRAAFTPNVKGEVSGLFDNMEPDEFLAAAYSAFGVEWYLMDDVVHFYVRRDLERRMVYLTACEPSKMRDILTRGGLLSAQLPCVADDEARVLTFVGPKEYADGVAAAIASYESSFRNDQVVRVFFLKHAWADDTDLGSGENVQSIPGVATILSEMVMQNRMDDHQLALGTGSGAAVRDTIPPVDEEKDLKSLRNLRGADRKSALEDLRRDAKEQMELDRRVAAPLNAEARAMPKTPSTEIEPRILADARSNAVIIRDAAYRMPYYEKTIKELDKPLQLVELHAAIVDVNVDYSSSLGMRWGGVGSGGNSTTTGGGSNVTTTDSGDVPSSSDFPNLISASGMTLSTIYSNGSDYFVAQVSALESKGKGRVLGRPSVLTIDNTSARLESSTTFYVRIVGTEVVDLQSVSSGTVLDVTPHIITEEGQPSQIKMAITIEDGSEPDNGSVDSDIPAVVKKTTIRTQGIVAEGQSLLIGGYYYETISDDETGVPVLMDVPALGNLFKTKSKTSSRMQRLILISPKLISLSSKSNVPANINDLGFTTGVNTPEFPEPVEMYQKPAAGGGCTPLRTATGDNAEQVK